jgi:hypothetical protein
MVVLHVIIITRCLIFTVYPVLFETGICHFQVKIPLIPFTVHTSQADIFQMLNKTTHKAGVGPHLLYVIEITKGGGGGVELYCRLVQLTEPHKVHQQQKALQQQCQNMQV